jgi:hypothetical protein
MNKFVLSWVAALCGIFAVVLSTDAAWAERKVALVVGNSHYKNPSLVLLNPKNDAEDVADVLRSLDFDVLFTVDANKRDLDVAMTQFARSATGADVALFYYAGHALQYQGRNYLMPIDGELEDEVSLRYQMVLLDDVRAALDRTDGVKIAILDACRNNPVVDSLRRKMAGVSRNVEVTRGLARIDKALGMVVAYSTAADDVAADGAGRNSPFTSALLRRLKEPGLEIGSMFRRIAADVNEKTGGRQRPETYVSLIGEYYLNQKDKPVWDQIKDSTDPAAFRNFITQFPLSPRASDAQYRLQVIERIAKLSGPSVADGEAVRAKLTAERERSDREAAQARAADEERTRLAMNERPRSNPPTPVVVEPQKQASLSVVPPAPARVSEPALSQEQICKNDEERLAQLRVTQVREDVLRLERDLGCPRLRAQVQRLKESLIGEGARAELQIASRASTQIAPREAAKEAPKEPSKPQLAKTEIAKTELAKADAKPEAAPQPVIPPQSSAAQPDEACKTDEEKLARLRLRPALNEVTRFEQELKCARLRPQIVRLRESLAN